MPFLGKTPSQIVDPEVDIDGGTIDGVSIGSVTANAGAFTNLTATGTLTLPDDGISGDDVNGGTISNFASTGIDDNATSTAIIISSTQNVGIGTSPSPALGTGLHIRGSGYANLTLQKSASNVGHALEFTDENNAIQYRIGTNFASGGQNLLFAYGSTPAIGMMLDSVGNVGIGTSSIDYQSSNRTVVHVEGSAGALLAMEDTGAKSYLFQAGNDLLIENDTSSGSMIFGTNASTERMRLDSSGTLIHKAAAVFNEDGGDSDFRVESDTNTHALFVDAGNSRVGINSSAPTHALTVEGVPHITNSGFAFHTVDKEVSSGSVTFSYSETTTGFDNFTGLIILCLYHPSTASANHRHCASYVGLRMIGRGAGGSLTQISKVQDIGITTFTVAASSDAIVVTTDSTPALRCRLIALGGGGTSVPAE